MIKTIAITAAALVAISATPAHASGARSGAAGPAHQIQYVQSASGECLKQRRHEVGVDAAGVHWTNWRTVSTKLGICPKV